MLSSWFPFFVLDQCMKIMAHYMENEVAKFVVLLVYDSYSHKKTNVELQIIRSVHENSSAFVGLRKREGLILALHI